MANIYFQKRVRGIDVFQVGKLQMWEWCGWSVSGPTYGNGSHALSCNSYSLAKGMYVVVSQRCIQYADAQAVRAAGGCILDSVHGILQPGNKPYEKPQVWDASRTLGGAVEFALEILASDNTELISVHVEVWHIVDDAELWQAWEHDSAIACKDGGQPTNYYLYDGFTCVLDLGNKVPKKLYAVTIVDDADQIVSAMWYGYDNADNWLDEVAFNALKPISLERQTANVLGLYIVDDWDHDEGLADGITVLNVYLRA